MKTQSLMIALLAAALTASMAGAQQPAAAPPPPALPVPELGTDAPDFEFTPITTGGIGKSTKLSALKGQTVVVWFFPKARTRG